MSENDITNMSDSEFESHVESLDAESAKSEIDKTFRAARSDPKHPYFSGDDQKAHKRAIDRVQRLFSVVSPEPEPELNEAGEELRDAVDPAVKKICDDAMSSRRDKLVDEGNKLISELVDLGFDEIDLPDDVCPGDIEIWKMQKMHAKENYSGLFDAMKKTLSATKPSSSVQNLFAAFRDAQNDMDSNLKRDLSGRLIEYFSEQNQYSKQSKPNFGRKKS